MTELTDEEKSTLANKYRPLLILYPEIQYNSQRKGHYRRGHRAGHPPIDRDYHPRDIGIVLDNAFLPRMGRIFQRIAQSDILDAMSNNEVEYIDLVRHARPSDVGKFWQAYASITDKDTRYPRTTYARMLGGFRRYAEYIVIQYWLAYFFDDWANVHEMDWEMASIVIKKTSDLEQPIACAYCVHTGGFRARWQDVEKAADDGQRCESGTHPVVYVANGSHASYFHDDPIHQATASLVGPRLSRLANTLPWVRKTFSDYVPSFVEGDKHFPMVKLIPEPDSQGYWHDEWRWLNFRGKWGSKGRVSWKETMTLPIEEDGPTGPPRKGLCWGDPFSWIENECFDMEKSSWILCLH
ncbi:MAG: hypothetical protein ACFE8Z_10730 [Candidatus Hermodarchaeota archaeon]